MTEGEEGSVTKDRCILYFSFSYRVSKNKIPYSNMMFDYSGLGRYQTTVYPKINGDKFDYAHSVDVDDTAFKVGGKAFPADLTTWGFENDQPDLYEAFRARYNEDKTSMAFAFDSKKTDAGNPYAVDDSFIQINLGANTTAGLQRYYVLEYYANAYKYGVSQTNIDKAIKTKDFGPHTNGAGKDGAGWGDDATQKLVDWIDNKIEAVEEEGKTWKKAFDFDGASKYFILADTFEKFNIDFAGNRVWIRDSSTNEYKSTAQIGMNNIPVVNSNKASTRGKYKNTSGKLTTSYSTGTKLHLHSAILQKDTFGFTPTGMKLNKDIFKRGYLVDKFYLVNKDEDYSKGVLAYTGGGDDDPIDTFYGYKSSVTATKITVDPEEDDYTKAYLIKKDMYKQVTEYYKDKGSAPAPLDLAGYDYYCGNVKTSNIGSYYAVSSFLHFTWKNTNPKISYDTPSETDNVKNAFYKMEDVPIRDDQNKQKTTDAVGVKKMVAEDSEQTIAEALKETLLSNGTKVNDLEDEILEKSTSAKSGGIPFLKDYDLKYVGDNYYVETPDAKEDGETAPNDFADDKICVVSCNENDENGQSVSLGDKIRQHVGQKIVFRLRVHDKSNTNTTKIDKNNERFYFDDLVVVMQPEVGEAPPMVTVKHIYGDEEEYLTEGDVTYNKHEVTKGDSFSFCKKEKDGYVLDYVTVNGENKGNTSPVTGTYDKDYTIEFHYKKQVTPSPTPTTPPDPDVPEPGAGGFHTGHKFTDSELKELCPKPEAPSKYVYSSESITNYGGITIGSRNKTGSYTVEKTTRFTHTHSQSYNCYYCPGHPWSIPGSTDSDGTYHPGSSGISRCSIPCTLNCSLPATKEVKTYYTVSISNCKPSIGATDVKKEEKDVIKWSDIYNMMANTNGLPADHEDTQQHSGSGTSCGRCSNTNRGQYDAICSNVSNATKSGKVYTFTYTGTGNPNNATLTVDIGNLELDHHNPGGTYPVKFTITDGDGATATATANIVIDFDLPDYKMSKTKDDLIYHTNETIPQGDFFTGKIFEYVKDVMEDDSIEGDKPEGLAFGTKINKDLLKETVTGDGERAGLPKYVKILSTEVDETLYVQKAVNKKTSLEQESTAENCVRTNTLDVCSISSETESEKSENWRAANTVVEQKVCSVTLRIYNPRNKQLYKDETIHVTIVNDAPDISVGNPDEKTTQLLVLYEEWTEDAIIECWSTKAWDFEDGTLRNRDSKNTYYGTHPFGSLDKTPREKKGLDKFDDTHCLITNNDLHHDGILNFYRFKVTDWHGKDIHKNGHIYFDTTQEGTFPIEMTVTDQDNATATATLYIQVKKTQAEMVPHIRYINKYFYSKAEADGGLSNASKWRTDSALNKELGESLYTDVSNATEKNNWKGCQEVYYFKKKDIKQAKDYMKNEIVNKGNMDFNEGFYNLIKHCIKKQ